MFASLPQHSAARSRAGVSPAISSDNGSPITSAPFQIERLKTSDEDLLYTADTVIAVSEPVTQLTGHMIVHDGRLVFSPVRFSLAQGRGHLAAVLDASRRLPEIHITGGFQNVPLVAVNKALTATVDGLVDVAFNVSGNGSSMRAVLQEGGGQIAMDLRDGTLTKSKAAALSGDLVQAIGLSLRDKGAKTSVGCAVADMSLEHGSLQAKTLMIETGAGHASGTGLIDLRNQTLSLEFHGEPLRRPVFELNAPVVVSGPLSNPKVAVRSAEAFRKAGLTGVLALVASPIVSRLPTVGTTLHQPDCRVELARSAAFVHS